MPVCSLARLKTRVLIVAVLLVVVQAAGPAAADETQETATPPPPPYRWQLGGQGYYSTGHYGTPKPTTIREAIGIARRLFPDGDLTVVVPYVFLTGDCAVTLVAGVPNRTGGTCPTRTVVTARGRVVTRVKDTVTTQSGFGDVLLRGRYYALDQGRYWPTIAMVVQVKVPTADPTKGLGTGKFDERFGLDLSRTLGERFLALADGGYTVIGKPAGLALRNQWYYDAGLGYYLTPDLMASLYYEWWRALIAGLQDPQDLLFSANYTMTPAVRLSASLEVGLSNGAPRTGVSGGINFRF